MQFKRFNIINAEDQKIGSILANNVKQAAEKLRVKYGSNACFLKLEYVGTEEKLPPLTKEQIEAMNKEQAKVNSEIFAISKLKSIIFLFLFSLILSSCASTFSMSKAANGTQKNKYCNR